MEELDLIRVRINVDLIDPSRLYQGEKGRYYEMMLIPNKDRKYNDYMVVESITKEEKEKDVKGVILGNGNVLGKKQKSNEVSNEKLPWQ